MSRRMDCVVLDSLGGVLPNQVYATLEIRACSVTLVHPCREDQSIRIVVSTVTGRFMLKPDPTTTNYIFILVGFDFSSSRGCRGRELGGLFNCYYILLLYNAAATSAALLFQFCYINCWLILTSCCKTRCKMLVFDKPSIFPLILVFLSCSPLYSPPFHLIKIYKCLLDGRKTRGYTRYSPA